MASLNLSNKQVKSLLKPQKGSMMERRNRRDRSRSRSRSRSKSRGKDHKKVNGPELRSAKARVGIVKQAVPKIRSLVEQRIVKERKLTLAKSGYFDVDKKDAKFGTLETDLKQTQIEFDNLVKEIQLAVSALKAGLGNRPIRMRLSADITLTATVTTGVVTTITIAGGSNRFTPKDATEWSTCIALFDEVKVHGGHLTMCYANQISLNGGSNINANGANSLPVMAYDPDLNTAAASGLVLTQLAQHEVWAPIIGVSGAQTSTTMPNHHFRFRTPTGTVVGDANNPGNAWTSTSVVDAVNQIFGYLRFYHVGNEVTAIKVGAGFLYYDVEFRCRT